MPMECSIYGKGVRLTLLRRRLATETLGDGERKDIEQCVLELERELEGEDDERP